MSAHTPGPWKTKRVPEKAGGKQGALVYFKLRTEDVTVAGTSVYVGKTDGATRTIPDEECQANARLIAAAPDLLAACESLLKKGEKAHREGRIGLGATDRALLSTVIAKARGQ